MVCPDLVLCGIAARDEPLVVVDETGADSLEVRTQLELGIVALRRPGGGLAVAHPPAPVVELEDVLAGRADKEIVGDSNLMLDELCVLLGSSGPQGGDCGILNELIFVVSPTNHRPQSADRKTRRFYHPVKWTLWQPCMGRILASLQTPIRSFASTMSPALGPSGAAAGIFFFSIP